MGATANPLKSDDKYGQKSVQLVRGSFFRSDFLQNPYFKIEITKAVFAVDLDRHCDQSQTDVPIGETIYFSDQNYH